MEQKLGLVTCGVVLLVLGILLFLFRADWILAPEEGMTEEEKRQKHEERQKFLRTVATVFVSAGLTALIFGLCGR